MNSRMTRPKAKSLTDEELKAFTAKEMFRDEIPKSEYPVEEWLIVANLIVALAPIIFLTVNLFA
ncbi:MAG: hypothetical protein VXA09_06000 [Burkholderiaceae bacterium]